MPDTPGFVPNSKVGSIPLRTLEYAPGRHIDLYGNDSPNMLLLWHGSEPDERDVLATLATLVASRGVRVLVPDWDSTGPDGGRSDLLQSVKFAREHNAVGDLRLVVGGWSLGGTAAASLAINARRLGLGLVPAVCLAGAFATTDPLSGAPFASVLPSRRTPGSIGLIHGTKDDIVAIAGAREFERTLRNAGWATDLLELPTDHAGIVGTEFDEDSNRCMPSTSPEIRETAETVSDVLAEAASARRPRPGN
ncbi:MAG: alpha/beta hydrolase [Aeromicrobium sp.]